MSVQDQFAPYLNRFIYLLHQKSSAKLEFSCQDGKVRINIFHELTEVEEAFNNHILKPAYNEVLKKNIKRSQINRLHRRALARTEAEQAKLEAEKAKVDAAHKKAEAEQAKVDDTKIKAKANAEKAKIEAEYAKLEAAQAVIDAESQHKLVKQKVFLSASIVMQMQTI